MAEWLKKLPARAIENALGNWLVIVVGAIVIFAASRTDDDVTLPAWLFVALLLLVMGAGFVIGRLLGGTDADYLAALEQEVELDRSYAAHIYDVLQTLQKAIAGHIPDVSYKDFIDRGVLQPARDRLTQLPGEEIRLSILVPTADQQQFWMQFNAGHSLESEQNFSLDINGSFAGLAFTTGDLQWSNDVADDHRFQAHPKARDGREYGSLLSVPVSVGGDVVAVLNAVSTYVNAFTDADATYLKLLGSVLDVAWSMMNKDNESDSGE
ncbi:MAG: GAF domain-containing protein [Solirubrobacteraceae bacterium]|nr:GAF domain-containing protein [Solirubrobacteraceae bacterium]